MAALPGAPTLPRSAQQGQSAPANATATAVPAIPFTRAARKKSRLIGTVGPTALGAAAAQLAPIQVPANGYLRKLVLDVTGTTAGNAAAVAFANDAPFNVIQQLIFSAANGDSIINSVDGFVLFVLNKYGGFSSQGRDPMRDPTFSKTTGGGATGGSFHFQLDVPVEFDSRDGAGALTNMAANQSFLLQMFLNASASLYTTAPTNPPSITITITAEYWAAPAAQNAQGIPQATAPITNGLVSLIQTQTPPIVPSTDQTIPLTNVGNTIRMLFFILRTAAGVRTETDWPNIMQISVNNDVWNFKTKNNWRDNMADEYNLFGGLSAAPIAGGLDNGVFVLTDYVNDGSSGDTLVSGASNRDLMLVTNSGTALNIEAQNWGATAGSLLVVTNSLRVPDASAFYHPFGN